MDNAKLPILDSHLHFFDVRRFLYPVFAECSAAFETLVGDYRAMPRVYLPEDYLRDTQGLNVIKTVWAEFMSDDPGGEVRWAQRLAETAGRPNGIIAHIDFLDPQLNHVLDEYGAMGHVRCVRQHLGWHPTNSLLRYAPRPNLMSEPAWQRAIAALRGRGLACELEIFSSQLVELAALAMAYPEIQFILPLMGWPVDLTTKGRMAWRRALSAASLHPNLAVKIFGMECLFGKDWTVSQIRPWILDTIEVFGPDRCMFASHMPICKLACSFQQLYEAYFEVIAEFSLSEKHRLLHDTAAKVYGLV